MIPENLFPPLAHENWVFSIDTSFLHWTEESNRSPVFALTTKIYDKVCAVVCCLFSHLWINHQSAHSSQCLLQGFPSETAVVSVSPSSSMLNKIVRGTVSPIHMNEFCFESIFIKPRFVHKPKVNLDTQLTQSKGRQQFHSHLFPSLKVCNLSVLM